MLLRCESITPLGRPVVPLVKRMTNGSSSSSATSGNGASGAYVSSAAKSSSNESTVTSSGSVTPSSRSSRRWSPSSSLGSVSSTAYAISSPVHQPLSPTATPPSATVAQNVERVLDRVGRDDGDAVTGTDAVLVAQRGRDRGDRLEDRRERVLPVGEDHVGLVAHALGRAVQQLDDRARPVGEREHARAEHVFFAAARTARPGRRACRGRSWRWPPTARRAWSRRSALRQRVPVVTHHQLRVLGRRSRSSRGP